MLAVLLKFKGSELMKVECEVVGLGSLHFQNVFEFQYFNYFLTDESVKQMFVE